MYLEHLINKVLAVTTAHLFTSSQLSFSKHALCFGVWVEEGGGPGPWAVFWLLWALPLFLVPLQSCLGLAVRSFLGLWVSSLPLPSRRQPEWPASGENLSKSRESHAV